MMPRTTFFGRLVELYAARYEPESARVLGLIVWRTLLALFAITIVGAIVYAVVVFNTVIEYLNTAPTSTKPQTALDRNLLDKTIQQIRAHSAPLDSAR